MSEAKSVFITGCSSGIGFSAAKSLATRGYRVFAGVRTIKDQQKLQEIANTAKLKLIPVICDVSSNESVILAAQVVTAELKGSRLYAIINNAGMVQTGPLLHLPLSDWEAVFNVNVSGVLRIVQAFVPLLISSSPRSTKEYNSRIINISSISGFANFPLNGAYCASKHALESLSVVLRRELSVYSIPVSVIQPGNVRTEIWGKIPEKSCFLGTDYGTFHQGLLDSAKQYGSNSGVAPEDITNAITHALESPTPKKYYLMPGETLKTKLKFILVHKLLPEFWSDKKFSLMAKK